MLHAGRYQTAYDEATADPAGFWGRAAESLHWSTPYERVIDAARAPFYRWFSGGELNTCYNAIDYHVENGRADQRSSPSARGSA